jgi:hypothetical protein
MATALKQKEMVSITKKDYESILSLLNVAKRLDLIKRLDKREENIKSGKFVYF